MADINDRLDRLNRREQLARRSVRPAPAPPQVAVPAGVDAGFVEVLDAVAQVVRRRPGLSVMVAAADGRPGRPVIRVTERDGDVETAVVAAGSAAHHAALAADDRHAGEPWTGEDRADGLRIVPQPEPASGRPTPAGGMVTLPADTSEVVARLAQLLREDPTLASSWGREAQES